MSKPANRERPSVGDSVLESAKAQLAGEVEFDPGVWVFLTPELTATRFLDPDHRLAKHRNPDKSEKLVALASKNVTV